MNFFAKLFKSFTSSGDSRCQISLEKHQKEIQKVTGELAAKWEEIRRKKMLLEKYWNTIIDVSKSWEVNFGTSQEALKCITSQVANTLGISRASIWTYHAENSERIECVAAFDTNANRFFIQQTLDHSDNERYFAAIKTERVIAAANALEHPDTSAFAVKYLQPLQIKSLMDTPFFQHGKLAGILCCEQQFVCKSWSEEDIIFATSMAEVVSLAFRSIAQRLYEKELESFSYSVAHDLKAPLRIIAGYSAIFESDYANKIDHEGLRLLQVIKDNTGKMNNLIDGLLDFSRLHGHPVHNTMLDMKQLLGSVLEPYQTLTEGSKTVEFRVGEMLNVTCDVVLMRQVLSNLISNAVKYSSTRDKPVVEVGSFRSDAEIVYYVKDNGVGFDPKFADKLFRVFQRLHNAKEFEGTGVGLAIVHRIISRFNGRVWAEAAVNEGATLYFSLPVPAEMDPYQSGLSHTA